MFIAMFENVCGIGTTVDLAMQDLHGNFNDIQNCDIDDENDIEVYDANQVTITKTWIIEPM